VTKNYRTKEKEVVDRVKERFPDYDWIFDKRVYDGCSKRRPDIYLDLGYQVIVIEIDEDKHSNYDSICENKRLMEISQDINFRPLIMIRFNPDSFIDSDGNNITSCWSINTKGLCVIKRNKKKEWEDRIGALLNTVSYWCENKSEKTVETVHLFY